MDPLAWRRWPRAARALLLAALLAPLRPGRSFAASVETAGVAAAAPRVQVYAPPTGWNAPGLAALTGVPALSGAAAQALAPIAPQLGQSLGYTPHQFPALPASH